MLLGSMFGAAGPKDDYLNRLRAAGLRDLDYQDCRHFGHDCDAMTVACFPETMATFYNGIGDFASWKPALSHRGTVYAGPIDVAVRLTEADWTVRYTLDGSDPHKAGQKARGPIRVETTCTLRVIGVSPDGKRQSRENLSRFTIQAPLPATAPGIRPGLTLRAYAGVNLKHGLTRWLADVQEKLNKFSLNVQECSTKPTSLAVDFSGASGAELLLAMAGPLVGYQVEYGMDIKPCKVADVAGQDGYATKTTAVQLGGQKGYVMTLQKGTPPEVKQEAGQVTAGGQTVSFDGVKLVLRKKSVP
jgi:hypothetical protein